jgi:TRAP-type C4-dicarboxylate transport system permease small subunit
VPGRGLRRVERAYAYWRAFQDRVLAHAASLLLLGCTLLALAEVVRRYAFGLSFEWQQDAVTYFILSGVFLYFGISQRHNAHLNVELLVSVLEALGPRARTAADVVNTIAHAIAFVFLLLVIWWGIPEVADSVRYESRSESLAFPMWPFLSALLVGFAFMAVSLFFQLYRDIQKLRGRRVLEEPEEAGGMPH